MHDLRRIGEELVVSRRSAIDPAETGAVLWGSGLTLGSNHVLSEKLVRSLPGPDGEGILPCEFVNAGSFRHGSPRSWCRTHQRYWGVRADLLQLDSIGMRCSNHMAKLNFVTNPRVIDLVEFAEVGIWCSMPQAISTEPVLPRRPSVHVHVRPNPEDAKIVDDDFDALAVRCSDGGRLFGDLGISSVLITPPAAFEFVCALEDGRELGCVNCSYCGYPHLDLGEFARKPHRKHICGHCGRDGTRSEPALISSPLKPLHDKFLRTMKYVTPDRTLNLDELRDCTYDIWASTPAIVWTGDRPQVKRPHQYPGNRPRDMGTKPRNFFYRSELEGDMWFVYCVPFADPSIPDEQPLDPESLTRAFLDGLGLDMGGWTRDKSSARPQGLFESHPERSEMSAHGDPLPHPEDDGQ